jgi:hypothetical protein
VLVRFSSVETESVTMFGDVAKRLITLLGGSGTIPGAIAAEDIPAALQRLRQSLLAQKQQADDPESDLEDSKDDDKEPAVELSARAVPLIDILERASAADAPVMWEKL